MSSAGSNERAIVIGGGIAGLAAAQVLARHFGRVTVLERDMLPGGPQPRPGAPQSHHVHVLLARGWRILHALFPGLEGDLAAAGAREIDWLDDVAWHTPFGLAPRVPSTLRSRACTRGLLEVSARRRLLRGGRVRVLSGLEVTGLRAAGHQIVGVLAQRRGADAAAPGDDDLRADLIVDASGRASRAPAWLRALGHDAPAETVIDAQLGYATRHYILPRQPDWQALYVMGRPPQNPRGGVVYGVEEGRVVVTLVGYNGAFPPTDEQGFLEFAGALASPALREVLADATPCSSIRGYRRTENRLRHFERLRRSPPGFIAIGDAVCALNPVYGQGMSVGAVAATVLDAALREAPGAALGRAFQRRLAASNRAAFLTASGDDLRWPHTTGAASPGHKAMHYLVDRVLRAATHDADVHLRLMGVLHLERSTAALLHPHVLRRALFCPA